MVCCSHGTGVRSMVGCLDSHRGHCSVQTSSLNTTGSSLQHFSNPTWQWNPIFSSRSILSCERSIFISSLFGFVCMLLLRRYTSIPVMDCLDTCRTYDSDQPPLWIEGAAHCAIHQNVDLTRFLWLGWIVLNLFALKSSFSAKANHQQLIFSFFPTSLEERYRQKLDDVPHHFLINNFELRSSEFAVLWALASWSSHSVCKALTLSSNFIACELCSSGDRNISTTHQSRQTKQEIIDKNKGNHAYEFTSDIFK